MKKTLTPEQAAEKKRRYHLKRRVFGSWRIKANAYSGKNRAQRQRLLSAFGLLNRYDFKEPLLPLDF